MKYLVFKNKNCFITGATGGIGRCVAMRMAQEGCNLFLTATKINKLKSLKKEIESSCGESIKVFYEAGDLNKLRDIDNIVAKARETLELINVLINCAGVFPVGRLSAMTLNEYESCFNLNIRSAFVFSKEFSVDMIKSKWGRIINIGSSSAYAGNKNTSLYCASKHALLGFSRSLHDELKGHNVRVFCVSPSGAKTEMGRKISWQDYNTLVDPEEVAEYIAFVSSFEGNMVSEEIRLNRMVVR